MLHTMFPVAGLFLLLPLLATSQRLSTIFEWNLVRYNTPLGYPGNGTFEPDRTIITSVEYAYDSVFLAVPKLWSNNPATVVYVPRHSDVPNPAFEAYPSWDWHVGGVTGQRLTESSCAGLINVFRIRIDRCGRLWALDSGVLNTNNNPQPICPPKLVAFDLRNHQVVKTVEIQSSVLMLHSQLMNFAIDDTDASGTQPAGNCDVGHIYISDVAAPAVVVYNVETGQMWRHVDPAFYPNPGHANFTIAGESYVFMDGIIGVTLSNPGPERDLFWSVMASTTLFGVSTAALKVPPGAGSPALPVRDLGDKSSQSIPLGFDPVEEALVYSPLAESALMSWKLGDDKYRALAFDPIRLQGVTEIRPAPLDDNNLWIVSTRIQKYILRTLNTREANLRVLRFERGYSRRPTFRQSTRFTSPSFSIQNDYSSVPA